MFLLFRWLIWFCQQKNNDPNNFLNVRATRRRLCGRWNAMSGDTCRGKA